MLSVQRVSTVRHLACSDTSVAFNINALATAAGADLLVSSLTSSFARFTQVFRQRKLHCRQKPSWLCSLCNGRNLQLLAQQQQVTVCAAFLSNSAANPSRVEQSWPEFLSRIHLKKCVFC